MNHNFQTVTRVKVVTAIVFIVTLAVVCIAQSPSQILKRAEKQMGGRKALQSIRSVVKRGTITRIADGAIGQYVIMTAKPNLFYERLAIGTKEFEVAFNGRSGWSRTVIGVEGADLWTHTRKVASDGAFRAAFRNYLWFNANADKAKLTSGGKVSINGRLSNLIFMTSAKGARIKMYFDAATGVLVRDETRGGDEIDITDYEDYRNVNSIKQPFFVRLTSVGIAYEIRFDEIRLNDEIPRTQFDFPRISNEPLPDISVLLGEVQAQQEKVEAILETYSFTQKNIKRELGKDGVLREKESETFKLTFYKGRRIRRLIEKNGAPLSAKDQADEDRAAEKQIEEIERKAEKEEKREVKGQPSEENRRISIAELLRASRLINPRRERFRGRDVIVFDFEPNPTFDMKNAKSMLKFFGKTAGVMWIDEKDKQVARIEAVLFESFKVGGGLLAKLQKGASFSLEQERVGNEIWLPSQAEVNLSVRVLLVKGIDLNQVIKSYDYVKFGTEVKDAAVEKPITP